MIRVKICGITRPEDAVAAREEGADYLGLVFAPSRRQVDAVRAKLIVQSIPHFSKWVGVFVNTPREEILRLAETLGISYLQLHGEESPEECDFLSAKGFSVVKTHRIQDASSFKQMENYTTPFVLFDSFSNTQRGGTGKAFNWHLLTRRVFSSRVFLSGGLSPEVLADALNFFIPFAVDVSSGVETIPGIKSREKIRAFIKEVRQISKHLESERSNA